MGITSLLGRLLLAAVSFRAAHATVIVVSEPGVAAYAQAVEGVAAILGPNVLRVVELREGDAGLSRILAARDTQLVIAVGRRALAAVQPFRGSLPVIATLALHGQDGGASGQVDLDVSIALQCAALRALWPQHSRLGIIRNPARSRYSAEALESRIRREGFLPVIVDCDNPGGLLKALAALKGKVDFLLSFPDPDLYNTVTIKPLVLASLENRIPIVGFSPAFVRACAAAGIYPDYREVGRQAAEMALRLLRGDDKSTEEGPRKIQVAVNQRILRLLGVDFQTATLSVEVFR